MSFVFKSTDFYIFTSHLMIYLRVCCQKMLNFYVSKHIFISLIIHVFCGFLFFYRLAIVFFLTFFIHIRWRQVNNVNVRSVIFNIRRRALRYLFLFFFKNLVVLVNLITNHNSWNKRNIRCLNFDEIKHHFIKSLLLFCRENKDHPIIFRNFFYVQFKITLCDNQKIICSIVL